MIFGHIVHCHGGYYSTSSCIDCIVDFVDMNDADDVVIGILARRNKNTVTSLEAWLIFKKEILNISQISVIGPITPIGGLFFILGWISLLIATIKNK